MIISFSIMTSSEIIPERVIDCDRNVKGKMEEAL
jgi:hypothetical protein